MTKITITTGKIRLMGWLNDTKTAALIVEQLPISGHANRWGDEIYFTTPLQTGEESPTGVVRLGDIAYWPPGQAMCVFFGKTPVGQGNEIRPYSPVTVIGHIEDDLSPLKQVKEGDSIIIDHAQE